MEDKSRHLTYFKVENFKRFESFEMKDLGQFNLIVGDNNVGKTSVLEALLVDESETVLLCNFSRALAIRKIKDGSKIKDIEYYINKSSLVFQREASIFFVWKYEWTKELTNLQIKIDQLHQQISIESYGELHADSQNGSRGKHAFSEPINQYNRIVFNYIPFYRGHDTDLLVFYKTLQRSSSTKERFIESLRIIIPEIKNIEPSTDEDVPGLILYQKNVDASIPLALFGDGALKLFRLLAEIIINKNGRLMIDEIDTGIHYSRFKEFWRVILRTAKENNVQLFMTTHNEECIKYFKDVLDEESELKNLTRSITLVEHNETKKVTAFTYSFEEFEHAINVGNEIRA